MTCIGRGPAFKAAQDSQSPLGSAQNSPLGALPPPYVCTPLITVSARCRLGRLSCQYRARLGGFKLHTMHSSLDRCFSAWSHTATVGSLPMDRSLMLCQQQPGAWHNTQAPMLQTKAYGRLSVPAPIRIERASTNQRHHALCRTDCHTYPVEPASPPSHHQSREAFSLTHPNDMYRC